MERLLILSVGGEALIAASQLVVTLRRPDGERTKTYELARPVDDTPLSFGVVLEPQEVIFIVVLTEVRDAAGCRLGSDQSTVALHENAMATFLSIRLARISGCPNLDGGAPETLPPGSCDPAARGCGSEMTCQVGCAPYATSCTLAGRGEAGTPCTNNRDCAPGTQCFDYNGTRCGPARICRRYCKEDLDCSGGGDAKSVCALPVSCAGAGDTPHRMCTVSCDPRTSARIQNTSGCAPGLFCQLRNDLVHADCGCPEGIVLHAEGESCDITADCGPALLCNMMGGTRVCRAICRCDAVNDTCTANDACPVAGTHCSPLTNSPVYGVCLP